MDFVKYEEKVRRRTPEENEAELRVVNEGRKYIRRMLTAARETPEQNDVYKEFDRVCSILKRAAENTTTAGLGSVI